MIERKYENKANSLVDELLLYYLDLKTFCL